MLITAVLILFLTIVLIRVFTRPGAWNGRSMLRVAIGLVGWFLVNSFLWNWVLQNEAGAFFMNPFRLVPLLGNILAVVLLSRGRRWIMTGILCAILVNAIGLLLFPAPSRDIVHTDPTFERVIMMAPFYMPFFFPSL